jgi:lysozyme family protein
MAYETSYLKAVDHAMLYEVGGFWNVDAPGARDGTNKRACGYVNDPTDPGGETKYGIAKNSHLQLDVAGLDWDAVLRIYYKEYWLLGDCNNMPPRLAALHFDGCINHGVGRMAKFVQTTVGAAADGDIGPATIALIQQQDEITLCNAVCDARVAYYNAIVAKRPDQGKYLKGWLRRVNEMRAFVTDSSNSFD